jgi:hypothetical protein
MANQPLVNPRTVSTIPPAGPAHVASVSGGQLLALVLSWVAVGLPLAWGVMETLRKTMALFQ